MKLRVLALLPLLALTACDEIETPGGHVPKDYLSAAAKFQGVYTGQFGGVNTTITVAIEGDRPLVKVQNANRDDLIGAQCGSRVGFLKSFQGEQVKGGYRLSSAKFAFDPGQCASIEGRTLTMKVIDSQTISMSLISRSHTSCTMAMNDMLAGTSYAAAAKIMREGGDPNRPAPFPDRHERPERPERPAPYPDRDREPRPDPFPDHDRERNYPPTPTCSTSYDYISGRLSK